MVSKETTGKAILSDTDEYALTEGWQPQTNEEVAEYNRYNHAWKSAMFAETDAQTIYLQAKVKYQSMQMMLRDFAYHPIYSELKRTLDKLGQIKSVNAKEAIDIINRQREEKLKGGQTIDGTINQLAYEFADEETKKELKECYADIDLYEHLDEVRELIRLYDKEDFEGIARAVAEICYNDYAKEYQLFQTYAGIPLYEMAKRYAKENNLPFIEKPDEELEETEKLARTLEKHAQEKKTTVKEIMKWACLKWINEGLLEKDYPITKEERELLAKWVTLKDKARLALQDLIKKGKLKTGKDDGAEIITGASLYNSGLDYAFATEFKGYVDEYSPDLGLVKNKDEQFIDGELLITEKNFFSRYKVFLQGAKNLLEILSIVQEKDDDGETLVYIVDLSTKATEKDQVKKIFLKLRDAFVEHYKDLLSFEELFNRLSKTYDMDLSYRIKAFITNCKNLTDSFNDTLLEALKPFIKTEKGKRYKDKKLFIDVGRIKPNKERAEPYIKEIKELLGDAF